MKKSGFLFHFSTEDHANVSNNSGKFTLSCLFFPLRVQALTISAHFICKFLTQILVLFNSIQLQTGSK